MNYETALSNAKEIANTVLAPAARQNDKDSHFSSEAIGAFGQSGLLALMLPSPLAAQVWDHALLRPSPRCLPKRMHRSRWSISCM